MKRVLSFILVATCVAAHAAGGGTMQIKGTFDIKMTPQPDTRPWSRQRLEKVFHGPLEGTSSGEMLAVRTGVKGSAGYVALEHVTATLEGRKGTFFLQHSGLMDKGAPTLTVSVVPDSGTGELQGLTGAMAIRADGGKHTYDFSYTLP